MSWTWPPPYSSWQPVTSLLKIPLMCAGAAYVHNAYNRPNPPPKADDIAKFGNSDTLMQTIGQRLTLCLYWAYALGESALILANALPSSTSLHSIVAYLVREGYTASTIRATPVTIIGWTFLCIGPLIRKACYRELGRFFTWELAIQDDQHIVTTGPYSIVRHPAYTGNLFMAAGTLMCHFGKGSWYRESGWLDTTGGKVVAALWILNVLSVPAMMMMRVGQEDEVLRRHFPLEWERYAKKTPYRLIPFIY
ncbi:hypothetical protein BC835DRAFT_1278802 [Cytidiella melzeri]|nr:hypothetical protein BC835DRAFT_1278802 [Cytidiella melzeri]